ncbi:MAG: hypothetical protein ACXAC5_10200 [Promethearchaeota archaeon]
MSENELYITANEKYLYPEGLSCFLVNVCDHDMGGIRIKVRAILVTLLILASVVIVIFDCGQVGIAQTSLLDDTPILDDTPVPDNYEFEVLGGEYAVVGVRPDAGQDNDLEIYTDNTYSSLITSSNSVGDMVDFVVLDKDNYTSPPDRGAKVTLNSRDYVVEMENDIETHPVFDSWGGSMDEMPGNPVMEVGSPGSWDDTFAYFPSVIYIGGIYKMWYSGYDGSNVRIGYATSPDGLTWTKYAGNPVLNLGSGWESQNVHYPNVIYYGGEYKMWYSGTSGTNYRIGYASSPDGITWTKYGSNPVLDLGPGGSFDEVYVAHASVMVEGGTYHMWYSGVDSSGEGRTGYAACFDGISWAKYGGNPVLNLGPGGSWDDFRAYAPSVASNGSRYFMSYMGNDNSIYRIGYAYSDDMINWTKSPSNPVLVLGPGGSWESNTLGGCSLLYDASDFKLWYHGGDGSRTQVGYATIPFMDNWKKYPGNPVLDIGTGGQWDDTFVRNPSIIFDGTTYHMWYSGYNGINWRIGYATSTDGVNWNKYGGNPVLNLGVDWWEDGGVLAPFVLFDGTIYHLWYSGDDDSGSRRIGYANSTDGINWNRYSGNPIIDIGIPGMWDDDAVYASTVFYDGSSYHMWYHGTDSTTHRIGYATSPDGLIWSKYAGNPVMDLGPPGSWDDFNVVDPSIIYDGSIYQMWYGGGDGSFLRIGYATSVDGINWQRYPGNPIIDVGPPGSYDDLYAYHHFALFDGLTYHTWYSSHDGSTYRIGYANIPWKKLTPFNEVLDAFEITGFIGGTEYTIDLSVPPTADLDMFLFNTSGGRNDAMVISTNTGLGIDESITFAAPTSTEYLLVVTNENGGTGTYNISFVDNPPIITNVTAVPDPQEVFGAVNISANITDDYQLYGAWVEIYDPLGGFVGNLTMQFDPIDGKYYLIQTYNMLGTYNFTIWTNDTNNNWITTAGLFVIHDTTPPLIINVSSVPDPQEVFGTVIISANITDNFQLFGPWVEIYDPFGGLIGNVSLLYDPILEKYYWTQSYDMLGIYNFTIWANDTSNNWASALDSFVIHDTTPPMIINVSAMPDPQEVFGVVNISVNITDNFQLFGTWMEINNPFGSLIGNVSLLYDPILGKYYWTRSYDMLGTYNFTIWANDTSNNWASTPGSFLIHDTTPPVIINVSAVPDPQEVFGTVNISVNVTDNFQLFGTWVEIYDPLGGLIGNVSLLYDPILGKYYWTQNYDILGTYNFTIWANDTSNNWALFVGSFVIHDTTPPVIINVSAIPDPQEVFGTVNMSVNITDNFQLFGTWVEIYDPFGGLIGNVSLLYDPILGKYYWTQNYDILGTYNFTIWANDTSNNWASAFGFFVIYDTTPPVIINVSSIPDPQEVFGTVIISANITDNFQLFGTWVEIYDPFGTLIGNFTLLYDPFLGKYYWTRSYDILGTHSFTIWTNDTSNNWASASGSFVIHDTTPPLISNIETDPNPQEIYGYVRISADISDNYQLSGNWIEVYDPTGTLLGNYSLLYDSIDDNWYLEQEYDVIGEYTFIIWASDVANNWNSAGGTFIIEDTTPPVIEDVITDPNPQEVYGAVDISATITDNYQLFGSWIEVSDPDGDFIGNYSMSYDTISGKYTWGDTFDQIGGYSFTILANDTENNWASYSGEFTIQDTLPPIILNDKAIPDPQEVFGTVTISANVTDNYELDDVLVEILDPNGNLLVNLSMEQNPIDLTYYWTQSYSLLGTYTYTLSANDTSNNIASVSGTFLIRDTIPPVISNVKTEPDLPEVKDPLNILATVTDNYQLHGVWIEIYHSDGVSYGNHSMDYDALNERYFLNQSFNKSGPYNFTIWANDTSDNWAGTSGSFEVEPEPEPDEYNWKPIIALIFSIILLIVGIIVVIVRPMKFTGELSKDRWYTLLAGVVPFVVAEAITGIISYFTGLLAIPPLLGIGMIVDLGILVIGLVIGGVIYFKGVPSKSYDEQIPPPPEQQTPPEKFQQDESEIPPPLSDELPPIPPPETPPPLSPPAPPEEFPPSPPSSPYEEIIPPF